MRQTDPKTKINNTQRKVIANLASAILDRNIQDAEGFAETKKANVLSAIKEDLGIDLIEKRIKDLERELKTLIDKKESLGISKYTNLPVNGTDAHKLYKERIADTYKEVRECERRKTDIISNIWATTKVEEAMDILKSLDR